MRNGIGSEDALIPGVLIELIDGRRSIGERNQTNAAGQETERLGRIALAT